MRVLEHSGDLARVELTREDVDALERALVVRAHRLEQSTASWKHETGLWSQLASLGKQFESPPTPDQTSPHPA